MSRLLYTSPDGLIVLDALDHTRYKRYLRDHFPIAQFMEFMRPNADEAETNRMLNDLDRNDYSITTMNHYIMQIPKEKVRLDISERKLSTIFRQPAPFMLDDGRIVTEDVQKAFACSVPNLQCTTCGKIEPAIFYWEVHRRFTMMRVMQAIDDGMVFDDSNNFRIVRCAHCAPSVFSATISHPIWMEYAAVDGGRTCHCDACGGGGY